MNNNNSQVFRINRKEYAFLLLVLIAAIIIGFRFDKLNEKKQAVQKAEIEFLYKKQNWALGFNYLPYYVSADEIDEQVLFIRLAAYNDDSAPDNPPTLQDIEKYLEAEYDDNGKPAVFNIPENIEAYLNWYWSEGGYQYIDNYDMWLWNYQMAYQDIYGQKSTTQMNLEELEKLINDFNSCPDREQYEHKWE